MLTTFQMTRGGASKISARSGDIVLLILPEPAASYTINQGNMASLFNGATANVGQNLPAGCFPPSVSNPGACLQGSSFQFFMTGASGYITVSWNVPNTGSGHKYITYSYTLTVQGLGARLNAPGAGMSVGAKTALIAGGAVAVGVGGLAIAGAMQGKGAGHYFGAAAEEAMAAAETSKRLHRR